MDRLEKNLIFISVALMLLFTGLVLYAGMGRGIHLPTSHAHLMPFTEGNVIPKENNGFEVRIVTKMWSFDPPEIVLPQNAEVDFYVSTVDVQHGFEIAGTNVNLMALPGVVNAAHHQFSENGEHLMICHEYCGLNHQNMFGKIRVLEQEEYVRYMQEQAAKIIAVGEKLSIKKDCASCHTADGSESIGPTFKGLFGRKTILSDGTQVEANEAYLIESIKNPDMKIVHGYDPESMPPVELTDQEIKELIDYIKTLK